MRSKIAATPDSPHPGFRDCRWPRAGWNPCLPPRPRRPTRRRPRSSPRPASATPPAPGSRPPSPLRPLRRTAPGDRSPRAATPWSSPRPGRARRSARSSGRSTAWPRLPRRRTSGCAVASSTSRRSRRWRSTWSATCAPRSPASATPPHASGCRPSPTSPSASAPATPARPTAGGSRRPRPTSSSPLPSRCSSCSPRRRARRCAASRRSCSTRCTRSPAPSGAPTSRCRWSGSTRCSRSPPSASACPRRSGRSRRSRASSAASTPSTSWRRPRTKEWDLTGGRPRRGHGRAGSTGAVELEGSAAGSDSRTSIWPYVEEEVVDLISRHSSTIVFANSRRLAERLTARFNEIATERLGTVDTPRLGALPAQVMAQSGQTDGADAIIARAYHHGSVSKEQRALIEEDLKAGRLPCVVATSSLELGIDMGAVDLVVQIESPPSVASALQRVGRAGHQVGEISRGVLLPKHRADLVHTAVAVERMRSGAIESLHVPTNPLDVLAQQVVATRRRSRSGRPTTCSRGRRAAAYLLAAAQRLRRHARPAVGALPLRRVRRAASAHRLGPRRGHADRAAGSPAPRGDQWRHDPRPGAVRRLPRRRAGEQGGRARRGDGLRVPRRRRLRAGGVELAHRGHHPRPGPGVPGARGPGPPAVLEGRPDRAPRRARRGHRRLHARAGVPGPRGRPRASAAARDSTTGPRTTWSPSSTSSARRPTCCPATAPCSWSGSATSSATGGWCCTPPTAPRSTRPGRWPSGHGWWSATASTPRRCPPTTASCSASRDRPGPARRRGVRLRPRGARRPGHRRGGRVGAVRLPVP